MMRTAMMEISAPAMIAALLEFARAALPSIARMRIRVPKTSASLKLDALTNPYQMERCAAVVSAIRGNAYVPPTATARNAAAMVAVETVAVATMTTGVLSMVVMEASASMNSNSLPAWSGKTAFLQAPRIR